MSFNKRDIILSIDVEDNFARDELVDPADWDRYETQVLMNTKKVITILAEIKANATFFVLGKVVERHTEVVEVIDRAGHEVASHGYAHELVNRMTRQTFEADVRKSINILEAVTSSRISGFRARSFSITRDTLWALDVLDKLNLEYDSSMVDSEVQFLEKDKNYVFEKRHGFREFPISTNMILGRHFTISGGIFMRALPFPLYAGFLKQSESFRRNGVFYCHVWEFNRKQPKRKTGLLQAIAQSPLLYTTEIKLRKLSRYYNFLSARNFLREKRQAANRESS